MEGTVAVVGGGPAGLAVAACLRRHGVDPLVLERGDGVGARWRHRYDRLHLHTPRVQSALPGLRIPRRFGRWVSRADVVRYLAGYARYHGITPRLGVEVARVDRDGNGWRLTTGDGDVRAHQVVVATGYNGVPHVPEWPGREAFTGRFLHAEEYREPSPFRGVAVLVVGAGNTGAEIAADLAEAGAGTVWLSVRTPPNIVPRQLGPLPITLTTIPQDGLPARLVDPMNGAVLRLVGDDLRPYGMPVSHEGIVAHYRRTDTIPTIDVGLIAQLQAGRVTPVAAVSAFDRDEVVLADGNRLRPDAVIAATGYRTGLDPVVGHLGVLDDHGRPLVNGARSHPGVPGLRFIGLSNPLKGLLFQINLDARATARAISRELGGST